MKQLEHGNKARVSHSMEKLSLMIYCMAGEIRLYNDYKQYRDTYFPTVH